MRFLSRSLTGLFLMAVTLGVLALAAALMVDAVKARFGADGPGAPAQERVFTTAVMTAVAGDVTPQITVYGEVRSQRTLEIRAPLGGTVAWLAADFADGTAVTAGQVLMRLDPADAQAARDIAASDAARASAELAEAERALVLARDALAGTQARAVLQQQALQRQKDLRDRGVGSDAAVEAATLVVAGADQAILSDRAALSAAESRGDLARTALARQHITLAEAERALQETVITAGFAGRLSNIAIVQGGTVGANERLADLIDPAALEVAFRVSSQQFARLVDDAGGLVPARVAVALEGTGLQATGQLVRVGAAVGAGQTGRLVYASLQESARFRPGDFVTLQIAEPPLRGVVQLPVTALGPQGTVLVLGGDDRLEETAVTVLRRQDTTVILAPDGIAGRDVVRERTPLLGAGIKVKPVREGDAAAQAAADAEPASAETLVTLTAERRAALIAFVEANDRMPADAKKRMLDQLAQDQVPQQVIDRLEQRMGG